MRADRMKLAKSIMKLSIETIKIFITRNEATEVRLFQIMEEVAEKAGKVVGQKLADYLIKRSDQDIIKSEKKVSITIHLISSFPKDWQEDLKISQERWIKQKYSSQKIRYLILKHLLYMIWVYIQIKIENIWFPKSDSTKEIE